MSNTNLNPQRFLRGLKQEIFVDLMQKICATFNRPFDLPKDRYPTRRSSDAAFDWIAALPDDQKKKTLSVFHGINLCGSRKSNALLVRATLRDQGIAIPDEFKNWTVTNMAAWAYVYCNQDGWKNIREFSQFAHWNKNEWTVLSLGKRGEARSIDVSEEKVEALRCAVCKYVEESELHGGYGRCTPLQLADKDLVYFLFDLNDIATETTKWIGGNHFEEKESDDACHLAFSYDRRDNQIQVHGGRDSGIRKQLCKIWAEVMLGDDAVPSVEKDSFNVERIWDIGTDDLPVDPAGAVQSARLAGVWGYICGDSADTMSRGRNRGGVLPELRKNLAGADLTRDDFTTTKIKIQVVFRDGFGLPRHTTFQVSRDSASYLSLPEEPRKVIQDFLVYEGIANVA